MTGPAPLVQRPATQDAPAPTPMAIPPAATPAPSTVRPAYLRSSGPPAQAKPANDRGTPAAKGTLAKADSPLGKGANGKTAPKAKGRADGHGEADAEADEGTGGPQSASGRKPKAKTGRGREKSAEPDSPGNAPARPIVIPLEETGRFALPLGHLDLPDLAVPFDAPSALTVQSAAPHTANDAKNPIIAKMPAAFAAAAATAARLHGELISEASRTAEATRSAAVMRFNAVQSSLDQALGTLDLGFDAARSDLHGFAAEATTLIEGHAAAARTAIARAASGAKAKLAAAARDLRAALKGPQTRATEIESGARAKAADIVDTGESAGSTMTALASYPEAGDLTGAALDVAQGEAIVLGLPPRATKRAGYFNDEAAVHEAFLVNPLNRLHNDMEKALADFNGMLAKAEKLGPAAVERARTGALAQVDATVEQLTHAIEQARDATESALVKQHNASRVSLIGTAQTEAKGERDAASARGGRDVGQILSLARGQGGAVKALVTGFEGERKRPTAEFATVVTRGSAGMSERLKTQAETQRPRLAESAIESRAALDRDAAVADDHLQANAQASADALRNLASEAGAALVPQAEEGSAGLGKLAGPVSATMKDYLPPLEKTGADKIKQMNAAIDEAAASISKAFDGDGGGDKKDAIPPPGDGSTPAPGKPVTQPKRTPNEFKTEATPAAEMRELADTLIAEFIKAAKDAVLTDRDQRASGLGDQLHRYRSDVDAVLGYLRGLTKKRGNAVRYKYQERYSNLEDRLRDKLDKWFSSSATNEANINAAIAALNGNAPEAAINEMKAAKGWWNDDARVDLALRALTPAQLAAMRKLPDGEARLDAIAAQLNGVDRKVFDLLRDAEAHPENINKANALRLQEGIDKARNQHGETGADNTFEAFKNAAHAAGQDTLSGDEGLVIHDALGDQVRSERSGKAWQQTLAAFDTEVGASKDAPSEIIGKDGKPFTGPGLGAYRYAIASRTYTRTVGKGDFAHEETKVDTFSKAQAQSLEALLVFGADSNEVAAARLNVLRSQGSKPDPKKLDEIMHDPSLDARPGEVVTPEEREKREQHARERYNEIYTAYEKYSRPPGSEPRSAEVAKQELAAWAWHGYSGDKEAQDYVSSLLKDPVPDTTAAFNYAIEGWGTNTDLLKKTFGRMNPDQVDAAVKKYNEAHPDGPSLYARLGIFGETGFFSKLSGDKKNEVEIAAMGVPVTDRDRFQVARMVLKQQEDQASFLSRHVLASDEFDNMVETSETLRKQAGFTEEEYANSFDKRGRFMAVNPVTHEKNPLGHFTAKGTFEPVNKGDLNTFNSAVGMAQLDATNYKEATDRIANFVTTAIVVAAAIISTVLTLGSAASLWIPVLVTAGAGLVGMGANYVIKGGRYGRDDMLHDLAMTVIQAATAGIGAGAGVALKGGMPALRLVAGAWKIEQSALRAAMSAQAIIAAGKAAGATEAAIAAAEIAEGTAAQAAQRSALLSLGKGLSVPQEILVGAGSSAFAGGASALLDADAWREGRYGAGVFHGIVRGGIGGGAGAGAAALGAGAFNRLAGLGRSAFKLPALQEGERAHWLLGGTARALGSGSAGFAQSAVEAGYGAAFQGRDIKASEVFAEAGWAAVQNAAQSIGEHGFDEHHASQERKGAPAISRVSDTEETARSRPGRRPEDEITPARPSGGEADTEQMPRREAAKPSDETQVAAKPRSADEPPPAAGKPRAKPPPLPSAARKAGAVPEIIEKMEPGWGIMAGNPKSKDDAAQIYKTLITDQPHLEAGVYRNTKTGEYITFQGNEHEVHVLKSPSDLETEAPHPEGYAQKWKEILNADEGDWELQAHYHPAIVKDGQLTSEIWNRVPSAEDGDFRTIELEATNRGAARKSRLHYFVDGQPSYTDFGFDPHSTDARYWVDVPGKAPGTRERHPFKTIDEYHAFFKTYTGGYEMQRAAPTTAGVTRPPAGTPLAPGEPRPVDLPDAFEFHHGTTTEGRAAIEKAGVIIDRGHTSSDDFGMAFYVSPERENAQIYASRRSGDANDPTLGAVLSFKLSREDMGKIVDVRPGGKDRAAWLKFLDEPLYTGAMAELTSKLGHPTTPNEMMSAPGGVETRAEFFEKFLVKNGLADADAVIGDLGGLHTSGIGGGEQIAIRSQRLADRLTAQLPGRTSSGAADAGPAGQKPQAAKIKPVAKPKPPAEENLAQPAPKPESATEEEHLPRELRAGWSAAELTEAEQRSLAAERYKMARERRGELGERVREARTRAKSEIAAQELPAALLRVANDLNLQGAVHAGRIFDDMVDWMQARAGDAEPLRGRRPATSPLVDWLRGRTQLGSLDLEGFVLNSVLEENVAAIEAMRQRISTRDIPPDAIFGVERGGLFLAEVLGHGDPKLADLVVRAKKAPDGQRTGDLERQIRARIADGQRDFAVVDFYMGGHAAGEFNEMYRRILADAPDVRFETMWMREGHGYERNRAVAAGAELPPEISPAPRERAGIVLQQTTMVPSDLADRVSQSVFPVRLVLGDDMNIVFDRSSRTPITIFDDAGAIVRVVNVGEADPLTGRTLRTTRDILIALMRGSFRPVPR